MGPHYSNEFGVGVAELGVRDRMAGSTQHEQHAYVCICFEMTVMNSGMS